VGEFRGDDLHGSRFEHVDLSDAELVDVDLRRARVRGADLTGAVLRGVELADVDIEGWIEHVTINGVDVGPLVEAELDRREPLRVKMRPTDAVGFLEAWDVLEGLWAETVAHAQRLPPECMDESVDGEWSFIETLRHLVFATDSWIRRVIHGDPAPWDPLGLPWGEMPDTPGVPNDRAARPSLETVLELRRDRAATVRQLIEHLTDDGLDVMTEPVEGVGWPPPDRYEVRRCLRIILNEEWEHRRFAERDLAVLEARVIQRRDQ
jgi:DinB superfamily/Pentapeptide repeats (8 copies)